ncbi:MAG: AsmA family protein, partial [bacterium]|nr:AsmA family protein [bacterium]
MKNFWKIAGFTALGIFAVIYLGFLFVLPNVIDLNQFKPEVQKIAKEQANLSVDFENPKIITTPLFGVGIKTDKISVKLPDNSVLFSADSLKTRVALPSIFVWTVKVSCVEINNPFSNLEIANNKQFKVITLVENILNSGREQKLEEKGVEKVEETFITKAISKIRIKVPHITVNNYKILVNDLQSKHYLKLTGEQLKAGYFNGKTVKVKTYAEIFSDENKNITANVNINTFLPPPAPALDTEDDPAERIDFPFINPVTMYRKYNLKTNLDTKLKVRENRGEINSYGYLNIDGLTLNVAHIKLLESYLHAKMFGTNVDLDTNLYVTQNAKLNLLGKLNYSKHPKMDMAIKSSEIKFNDLLLLSRAFLDTLAIPHELAKYTATGSLKADCYVKTNFKKLKSNGSVIIKNGGVIVQGVGRAVRDANINIILDNNILDIKDSQLFVNNSEIDIDGKIDEKSIADIKIKADRIPLPMLFYSFAPQELRNAYHFRSADASFELNLNGKLKEAVATVKAGLDNLNISDRANSLSIQNKKFSSEFYANKKELRGKLTNEGLLVSLPQTRSTISAPQFETEIADNNIFIKENKLNFNDNSSITYSGEVIDYNKLKSIKFVTDGKISTDDMIKLIGRELKPFIHSQGSIPVKVTFDGNGQKQTLFAQALTDKANFITPVDFTELQGQNVSLQSIVDFKGNRIKIKKTGAFTRDITVDEKGNEIVNLNEIFGIDGTIAGNRINLIKITMPKDLNGKIYVFPRSKFTLSGKAYVFGDTSSPRLRGGFDINNLSIPEILVDLRNAGLRFRGHDINFSLADLILNGSDIQVNGNLNILPSPVLNITNLNVNSRYLNVDKMMTVVDKAMKYVPAAPQNAASSKPSQSADIPVEIRTGSINLARIITGNIDVKNTTARISMARNVFYLNNLRTHVFDGNVHGNISMNLINSLLKINLQGNGVDVDKAMTDAANMKGMLSGKADFDTDISLQGATLDEQMRSLKGDVNFLVKDGQFGPFGKLENMIIAENIRESAFFQTALGGIVEGLFTIDTTHFSELNGSISFEDCVCHINPITSLGNILSLHVFGDFDLFRNYADMKVRARMASLVSNLLGPIGAINPANMINSVASTNVVTAKAFSIFCEMVPEEEIAILPSFSNKYVDNAATKFQIVVRGDVAKPLKLVKSFKWLATASEYDRAVEFVNSLPEPIEGSTATTIEEVMAEQKA